MYAKKVVEAALGASKGTVRVCVRLDNVYGIFRAAQMVS